MRGATCKKISGQAPPVELRLLSSMLCDDLDGWAGRQWEGSPSGQGYMYNSADSLCSTAETNIAF